MEPTDRRCPFCGSRRSVAVTAGAGLPAIIADASDPILANELQQTLAPEIVVLRELGRGGMGLVFLARESALRRLVVIKVLAPELAQDATARARFRREAEAAAAVAHPNVVAVHQAGELPRSGTAYLVMQFIDGPTLAEEFPPGTVAPEARARRVMGEVAAALAAAHARGLIHRDIKPANVMLERETGRAIVLDFGVSAARRSAEHRPGPRITQEGVTLGTPVYMSPEQAAAEPVTDRSDVYSLGVVMFELVTGQAPFEERTPVALAAAHLHKAPPTVESMRPDLNPEFAGLIDRCLAKDPAERPDAATLARTLVPMTSHQIEWPPPGLARLHGAGRRTLWRFRLAGAAAFAYLVILGWFGTSVAGPGWLLLSAGIAALACGITFGAARASGRSIRWFWAGRQAGYPPRVLLDTAFDPPSDHAALIHGAGAFALIPPDDRARWSARRRAAAGVELTGLGATALLVVSWAIGLVEVDAGSALSPISLGGTLLLASPGILGAGIAFALRWPEFRVRVASRRRSESVISRLRAPVIRRDLAEGWLLEAGEPPLPARSRWSVRALRALSDAAPLPLVGLVFVILGLTWSTAFTRDPIRAEDALAWDRWVATVGSAPHHPTAWARLIGGVDSALVGWGDATPDTVAARRMMIDDAYGLPRSERAPWAKLTHRADSAAIDDAWTRLPERLTPAQVARLAGDTDGVGPGLATFRRMARSDLPGAWYQRAGVPTISLGEGAYRLVIDYAFRDAAAGALAFDHHDLGAATERARELLGIARPMLRAPSAEIRDAGTRMTALAGTMLLRIARQQHDQALGIRASGLVGAAQRAADPDQRLPLGSASQAAAVPDTALWLRLSADRGLSPATRWSLLQAIVNGGCWNQQEVFRGISTARWRLLRAMTTNLQDLSQAGPIARSVAWQLTEIDQPWRMLGVTPPNGAPPPAVVRAAADLALRPGVCYTARWRFNRPVN
jgi:hypothetical protein